jgi:plastocyanin
VHKTSRFTLVAIAVALGISACGGSSGSSSSSSSAAATPPASSSTATSPPPTPSTSAASSSATASSALSVAADPTGALKFTKSTLIAKAGAITISFTNKSPLAHNLTVQQGTNGPVLGATPTFTGGTKTLKLTLEAGTYTYYCSVPGHRAAGMQGTLTVQ